MKNYNITDPEDVRISTGLNNDYNVSLFQGSEWIGFSSHRFNADAIEITKMLQANTPIETIKDKIAFQNLTGRSELTK